MGRRSKRPQAGDWTGPATCWPTFIEPLKIEPTGMTPSRWCRATARSAAEAMQPHWEQSGATRRTDTA